MKIKMPKIKLDLCKACYTISKVVKFNNCDRCGKEDVDTRTLQCGGIVYCKLCVFCIKDFVNWFNGGE